MRWFNSKTLTAAWGIRWLRSIVCVAGCSIVIAAVFFKRIGGTTASEVLLFGIANCLRECQSLFLELQRNMPYLINTVSWLILPGIGVFGAVYCFYYGRILFFKLQCSLLDLMVIMSLFGLVDGLLLSTPGALKMGLYLSTVVAAWVLSAAVTGRTRAELFDSRSQKARLLHLVAALYGRVSLAMVLLGVAILYIPDMAMFETKEFQAAKWPFITVGGFGFVMDLALNFLCRKRARELLSANAF